MVAKNERDVSRYNYNRSLTIMICRLAIKLYLFFYVFRLKGASKKEKGFIK